MDYVIKYLEALHYIFNDFISIFSSIDPRLYIGLVFIFSFIIGLFCSLMWYHVKYALPREIKKFSTYSEKQLLEVAINKWRDVHFECPGWKERVKEILEAKE